MTDEQIDAIAQPFLHLGDGDAEHDSIDWRGFARAILARQPAAIDKETVAPGMTNGNFHCPACGEVMRGPTVCGSCLWQADTCGYQYSAAPSVEQDERGEFEAWARNEFDIDAGTPLFREGKGYMGLAINAAWRAWRGSWQARGASTSANVEHDEKWDEVPVEIWHGDRKVTIYSDTVLRVWGSDIEPEMSDAPRTLQSVQDAVDWLYANVAQGAEAQSEPVYQRRKAGLLAWHDCSYEEYSEVKARIGWNVHELFAAPQGAAAVQAKQIEQYVLSVLPSVYYMDPPDGGSVSVLEQLRRMADDAAKYRAAHSNPPAQTAITITRAMVKAAMPWLTGLHHMRNTDAKAHIEEAIKAALTAAQSASGADHAN